MILWLYLNCEISGSFKPVYNIMIFGDFSFSSKPSLPARSQSGCDEYRELVICSYVTDNFNGGFYLNSRLPRDSGDFLFIDQNADTEVLMWGNIYNREQLIRLTGMDDGMRDPELVGRLFANEGPDFVRQLNGDFAVFIRQPMAGKAYLFRDHVGIRPLAWAKKNDVIFFTSDITGLCRTLSRGERLDAEYLMPFFRYIDLRLTPCCNVKKVLPGHYIEFTMESIRSTRYWFPGKTAEDHSLTHERVKAELGEIARDAIRIRCDGRYHAAAHVSGGLDSCFVAAYARRGYQQQEDFPGYSWSPKEFAIAPEPKADERQLVKNFCDYAGIRPVFSSMSPEEFRGVIGSMSDNHGVFAEKHTLKQAVADDVNLIFSGWGGDEFISTGSAAIEADLLLKMKFRLFFRRNSVIPVKRFVRRILYCILLPAMHIHERSVARAFRNDSRYLKKPFRKSDRTSVRRFHFNISRRSHHLGMLEFYHLQQRCESWAVNGYRQGVEYRYPLLDRRIVEYMLRVPSVVLCETDHFRPLLREIGEDVLIPEVRFNFSKNDPVYRAFINKHMEDTAKVLMDEANSWTLNPDLHFIDFSRLEADIAGYRSGLRIDNQQWLLRSIVYIKALHEFTTKFHKSAR